MSEKVGGKVWSRTVWMDKDQLPDLDDWMSPAGDPLCWPDRELAELNIPPSDPVFEVTITKHDRAGRQVPRWLVVFQSWSVNRENVGSRIPIVTIVEKWASPEAPTSVFTNGWTESVDFIEATNYRHALRIACEELSRSDIENPPVFSDVWQGSEDGTWTFSIHRIAETWEALA